MRGLKTTETFSFTILKAKIKVSGGPSSLCWFRGESFLVASFPGAPGFLGLWQHNPISVSIFKCLSFLCLSLLSLLWTPVIGFAPYLNPACPHQETFHLVTSAKNLCPKKVTFKSQGLGFAHIFLEDTIQPTIMLHLIYDFLFK